MGLSVGQVDRSKLAAMYASTGAGLPVAPLTGGVQGGEKIDVKAVTELARRNAAEKVGAVSDPKAVSPVAAIEGASQPKVAKVDAGYAKNMFTTQLATPNANRYNSFMAGSLYGGNKSAQGTGAGVYDGNATPQVASVSDNPFMPKNSSQTTGLSFSGTSNLNPAQKMFIV